METLFDPAVRAVLERRVAALRPGSPRLWGRMDAGQMLAHCAHALETATGDRTLSRGLLARLLGPILAPLFRGPMLGEKPFPKDGPTHPELRIRDPRDFEAERRRLLAAMDRFCAGGPEAAARHPHALLGRLSGEEWGRLQRKHLDHHLSQFGA